MSFRNQLVSMSISIVMLTFGGMVMMYELFHLGTVPMEWLLIAIALVLIGAMFGSLTILIEAIRPMPMVNCPDCGGRIPDDEADCAHCGSLHFAGVPPIEPSMLNRIMQERRK